MCPLTYLGKMTHPKLEALSDAQKCVANVLLTCC